MEINQIHKIGRLTRLAIGDEEATELARTLSDVLELVEKLDAAGLEGVEPLAHPLDITQRLREDRVTENDSRESMQAGAPKTGDGLYLVPKVIE